MKASSRSQSWWESLGLRRQLTLTLIAVAFFAEATLALAVYFHLHSTLLERAMDLLVARNAAATKQFQMKIDGLRATASACDASSRRLVEELSESPYFLARSSLASMPADSFKLEDSTREMVVAVNCPDSEGRIPQLKLESKWLSNLFTDRAGLGDSGEVYFITHEGELLTDSRFLAKPGPAPVPPGFKGDWQGEKLDYRGIPVFGVWKEIRLGNFRGVIASEIDVAEVFEPEKKLWSYLAIFFAASLLAVFPASRFLAAKLSWRTEREAEMAQLRRQSLIEGQERERKRIGLELHDDIVQEIAALNWNMSALEMDEASRGILQKAIQRIVQKIRDLSSGLMTTVISTSGLADSLRQLIRQSEPRAKSLGLTVTLEMRGDESRFAKLDREFSIGVYRIAQEAFNNMMKHSGATLGHIEVDLNDRGDLKISVEDNGKGLDFERARTNGGLGLQNIQTRADALNGRVEFLKTSAGGLRVEARFESGELT